MPGNIQVGRAQLTGQAQHFNDQRRKRPKVDLAKIANGSEIRPVVADKCSEGKIVSHAVLVFRLEQTLVYLKEVSRIQASLRVNFLALLSESRPERESRRGMNRNAITCRVAFLAFSFAH